MEFGHFSNISKYPQILSLKSLLRFVRHLLYTIFIINNPPLFHLWWKEHLVKHQKVSKYYEPDSLQIFLMLFYVFIKNWFFQEQSYLGKNFLCVSKKCPQSNLKGFWNQIWTSVKRSENQLSSKRKFDPILQLDCLIFRLKQCQKL